MTMESNYISITKIKISKEFLLNAAKIWNDIFLSKNMILYLNKDENILLQISHIKNLDDLKTEIKSSLFEEFKEKIKPYCESDFQTEILELKDVAKNQNSLLPFKKYLQLRHIEVPLKTYNDYLDWRKDTIFKYVSHQDKIDSFVAYHSILSSNPGVMFLSSFSCPVNEYVSLFQTPTYQDIVKTAGNKYIAGGKDGLYTVIYEKS